MKWTGVGSNKPDPPSGSRNPLELDEMAQNTKGFDPTQTAEYWLEKNVYTVPLRSRSKRPKSKNWPHLRLVEDDLQNGAFQPGDNIGALWGEPSDYATDVDLDMDEAISIAEYILPETFIYGRRHKEYSHYVYRCVGAQTKKWQTKDLGTIIEIRSTGSQSVIPPSRHPEGGWYAIDVDEDFNELSKLELERLADEVAVGAVFLHFYPQSGSRHDYVHACTGALCHAEWQADKIKRVMGAVLTIIQDEDDEMKDRMTTVVNTIEKHASDRTKGWTSLEDWMSKPIIHALKRWATSGRMEGKLLVDPPTKPRPEASNLTFDMSLLDVPGLVGDIIEWSNRESYIDQPMFGLATALTCTALASCNNYLVEAWDTPLQPYVMVTASTGGGKDTCHRSTVKFGQRLGLEEEVIQHFQSYYAMLDHLGETGMACWCWDEAARYMAAAKKVQSADFQVLSHVISLYGSANKFIPGAPGRTRAIPPLERPFFIVLATAQPDMLMDALTSTAQETGFVNRFLLIDTGTEYRGVNQRRTHVFPSKIRKQARLLRDHEPQDGDYTHIRFADTRTYTAFQEYEENSRRRAMGGQHTWGRANQNALIMAGLAAIGIDSHRPVIDIDLASWAIQLVTWSNDCWESKMQMTASGNSYTEKDSFKIERIINNPHNYIEQKANTGNQKALLRSGFTPQAVITRNTRSLDPRRREQILDDLHEANLIGSTEKNDQIVFYPLTPK